MSIVSSGLPNCVISDKVHGFHSSISVIGGDGLIVYMSQIAAEELSARKCHCQLWRIHAHVEHILNTVVLKRKGKTFPLIIGP